MASKFFELVNDKFFNPLTSSNKQLNFDLLSLINKKMDDEMRQFQRDDVINWITEYLENCPTKIIDDETGNEEGGDYKAIASSKLRYFVSCGWLVDENDTRTLKTTYQLDNSAILLLNAMDEIVKSDSKPMEYTGYVYYIYSALSGFKFEHSVDIVEQMYKTTKELIDRLRGLNVSIKKFLKSLLSNEKLTPREILEQFLIEYQDKVILKNFKNLREKDNPAKYKNYIIEHIDNLFDEENYSKMIKTYIDKKKDGKDSEENRSEADEFFRTNLNYVESQFESIEENLDMLDKRNAKYVSTAQSRISFLINEDTDIEGKIVALLKSIAESDDFIEDGTPFKLFDLGKLDSESLYLPRNRRRKAHAFIENIEQTPIDEQEIIRAKQRMFKEEKFNCSNVNKFIMTQLENKKSLEAKDAYISNFDDMIKLFLACLYSENKMIDYKISFFDDEEKSTFMWKNKRMTNFIVERK